MRRENRLWRRDDKCVWGEFLETIFKELNTVHEDYFIKPISS